MKIYCPRYKITVDTEALCNCKGCIFWRIDPDSWTFNCEYIDWKPGLKKGRDTSSEDKE